VIFLIAKEGDIILVGVWRGWEFDLDVSKYRCNSNHN